MPRFNCEELDPDFDDEFDLIAEGLALPANPSDAIEDYLSHSSDPLDFEED